MKITTTKKIELTAVETGKILCDKLAADLNADGKLGTATGGHAKDLDGLAAEVTLTFVEEGK